MYLTCLLINIHGSLKCSLRNKLSVSNTAYVQYFAVKFTLFNIYICTLFKLLLNFGCCLLNSYKCLIKVTPIIVFEITRHYFDNYCVNHYSKIMIDREIVENWKRSHFKGLFMKLCGILSIFLNYASMSCYGIGYKNK